MRCLVVAGLLLLAAGSASGQNASDQSQAKHNGYWWNDNSSETYKLGYVAGYSEAMFRVAEGMYWQCLADKNGGKIPEKLPPMEMLKVCAETPARARYDFSEMRFGQLVEGVNEFYKDFRNKTIHINVALDYVRDQLKGNKSTTQLEEQLTMYRRNAAR